MSDFRTRLDASIAGQYVIDRELGGGGMSRTYVATERSLNRRVVIKVLAPELLAGISVERFNREVLLAAQLQHPHIVPVLGAGDADGLPWFTMPYVDGESLRARLVAGPLPIGDVVGILRDVARALAFAHSRGVVHRDIKPDNVLLSGGSATVTDFGIAKAISASRMLAPGGTLTVAGTSIGTPAYMAPEQAAGDPDTDHRADIYAFGVMGYELLSGRTPFHDLTPTKLLAAHMSERPRDIREMRPDVPPALADLVMRCLEKAPEDRPQQVTEIVKVLDSVTSTGAASAAPTILAGNQIRLGRAIGVWAGATALVSLTAWAATAVIGLPDWVLPGSIAVMLLGLPIIGLTAYVQRTAYRMYTATPTLTPGGTTASQGTMATLAVKAMPHVSWRRTWIGGAVAVGAFAALVLGFMVMRALGIGSVGSLMAKGAFGSKETLVVADFASPANDSTLGVTVSEALRTDLQQSSNLTVLTKASVAEVLRLMQKPTTGRVPYDLAREVASREGDKAVLDGSIVQLGSSYVLSARLVSALDGTELAQFRRTAKNQDDLVAAVDGLSKDIRGKVGESLRNVRESVPLERVTTSSLPALRKYVEGVQLIAETGDNAKGRALLQEAVGLDSTFAMAWRRIAASYTGEFAQGAAEQDAIGRAFKYRDRLSENERLLTEASYYEMGPAPDRDRAIAAYESLIERDSTNRSALNNAATLYDAKRDFAHAEALYRRSIAVTSPFSGSFIGLIFDQLLQSKVAAADSTLAMLQKRLPSYDGSTLARSALAIAHGDTARSDSLLHVTIVTAKTVGIRAIAATALSNEATLHGRLREGERWTAQTIPDSSAVAPGAARVARLSVMLDSAWVRGYYLNDSAGAHAIVRRAEAAIPVASIAAPDRPWVQLLTIAAVTHDAGAARTYEAAFERDLPASKQALANGWPRTAQAMVALAENHPKAAAADFAAADANGDLGPMQIGPWRAKALDLADQPDSAIAEFERYLTIPDPTMSLSRDFTAGTHLRLGELYEAKGNTAKAIEHYQAFVTQWQNADPELQPMVTSTRAKIALLRRKGG